MDIKVKYKLICTCVYRKVEIRIEKTHVNKIGKLISVRKIIICFSLHSLREMEDALLLATFRLPLPLCLSLIFLLFRLASEVSVS